MKYLKPSKRMIETSKRLYSSNIEYISLEEYNSFFYNKSFDKQ